MLTSLLTGPMKALPALALLALVGCDKTAEDTGPAEEPAPEDFDGDGFADAEDCNSQDATIYPGASEAEDYLDNDCDGVTDEGTQRFDDDGDGFTEREGDCDDADPGLNPDATEIPYDGIDQDCDSLDVNDVDGDGYDAEEAGGDDCDDTSADVHPDASEWANGRDDNCNDVADEQTDVYDDDGDGYSEAEGDCDDDDSGRNPDVEEIAYDGIDQDCDLKDITDVDGDGYNHESVGGNDCDDGDATIHPEADDVPYDDIDQDCDGVDLTDVDGDGFTPLQGDCDDEEDDSYPGAEEIADYLDNDCDDDVDENTVLADDDGDGYSEAEGDCDDDDVERNPGAEEVMNEIDDDCNDLIDEMNVDGAVEITGRSTSGYFGQELAAGDWNCDGVRDLAVAARYDDEGGYGSGQVWIIDGLSSSGSAEDKADYSFVGGRTYSYFGTAVESVPDLDGDGCDELLISAPNDYLTTSYEGLYYLIPGGTTADYGLEEAARDAASDIFRSGATYDYAGDDLDVADFNGDGYPDMALGNDYYGNSEGSVYLISGDAEPGDWGTLNLSTGADQIIRGEGTYDYFGARVYALPDVDGDGYDDLLARASSERAAYLFSGAELLDGSGTLSAGRDSMAKFIDGGASSSWAQSAGAGDIDGDGDRDLMMTSPSGSGAVMFFLNDGGWSGETYSYDAQSSVAGSSDGFGYGGDVGDIDGDGDDEVIVGSYNYSGVDISGGAVWIFDTDDYEAMDGATHDEVARLLIGEGDYLYLGYHMIIDEDFWAVGTYGSSSYNNGAVYMMEIP